jgi:hypothetical protein
MPASYVYSVISKKTPARVILSSHAGSAGISAEPGHLPEMRVVGHPAFAQ